MTKHFCHFERGGLRLALALPSEKSLWILEPEFWKPEFGFRLQRDFSSLVAHSGSLRTGSALRH